MQTSVSDDQKEPLPQYPVQFVPSSDDPAIQNSKYEVLRPSWTSQFLRSFKTVDYEKTDENSENVFNDGSYKYRQKKRNPCVVLFRMVSIVMLIVLFSNFNVFGLSKADLKSDITAQESSKDRCGHFTNLTRTWSFHDLKTFTIRNQIRPAKHHEHGHEHFQNSNVHILAADKDQTDDIVVRFTFNVTNPSLLKRLVLDATDSTLTIRYPDPDTDRNGPYGEQCIESQTTIYVRPELKLDELTVESWIFGITIPEPVSLTATTANFTLLAGSMHADPMFEATNTYIHVAAGSVKGTFPLHNELSIQAAAGTVAADIVPRETKLGEVARSAKLTIATEAGGVHVEYQPPAGMHSFPERDYQVNISSRLGHISGSVLHGSLTSLQTAVGNIRANILPFAADRYPSDMATVSHAGRQMINLLTPLNEPEMPLARLDSRHTSNAGEVDVTYPKTWEGVVEAVSAVGRVAVGGPDVHIIKQDRKFIGGYVEAERGEGDGSTLCRAESGSVRFTVAS
ncbi:hypothetical protein BT63DRAFT_283780 [Microthyrium microscopicum]|uniref:Adhesin domain-containing protein n=1 Tax=Microthyrium microscopicum TaxID=703497 RepID=A0A6A6U9U0_9PEZI|nr:hypothetical protein BT63DRAFT_283780 [Microthyrium microscopicum]